MAKLSKNTFTSVSV